MMLLREGHFVEERLCLVQFVLPLEVTSQTASLVNCSAQADFVAQSDGLRQLFTQVRVVERGVPRSLHSEVAQQLVVRVLLNREILGGVV